MTGEDPTFSSREVRVPIECPQDIEQLIEDCLGEEPEERPDMKTVYDSLRKAASIPPPGASEPLPTPLPTPPISREGSIRYSEPFSSHLCISMVLHTSIVLQMTHFQFSCAASHVSLTFNLASAKRGAYVTGHRPDRCFQHQNPIYHRPLQLPSLAATQIG